MLWLIRDVEPSQERTAADAINPRVSSNRPFAVQLNNKENQKPKKIVLLVAAANAKKQSQAIGSQSSRQPLSGPVQPQISSMTPSGVSPASSSEKTKMSIATCTVPNRQPSPSPQTLSNNATTNVEAEHGLRGSALEGEEVGANPETFSRCSDEGRTETFTHAGMFALLPLHRRS